MKDKFRVFFWSNGRGAALELCFFCKKLCNYDEFGMCRHYENNYEDNACSGFEKVDDVGKAMENGITYRYNIEKRRITACEQTH